MQNVLNELSIYIYTFAYQKTLLCKTLKRLQCILNHNFIRAITDKTKHGIFNQMVLRIANFFLHYGNVILYYENLIKKLSLKNFDIPYIPPLQFLQQIFFFKQVTIFDMIPALVNCIFLGKLLNSDILFYNCNFPFVSFSILHQFIVFFGYRLGNFEILQIFDYLVGRYLRICFCFS